MFKILFTLFKTPPPLSLLPSYPLASSAGRREDRGKRTEERVGEGEIRICAIIKREEGGLWQRLD
jgi:hypothetical protein